jgi:flagellar hook protein FlgE
MSFYTALTGLNGSQAEISATSNNIANVGTTGFKRSRAEFGDIFATSPLQSASSSIGSGTILKGIKQQFTQGNIASSLNALDLAISGQGFFTLAPSLTASQTVYTRNGSFNVNNDRYVVDSAGQFLMTYPVNSDGSVTAKDLNSAVPLQLPVTSGQPQATGNISLGVNVNSESVVVANTVFNPSNPETYTNSTSITIFDDLGNPTIATAYFIKTQTASAGDPTNKYDTRLVIGSTIIDPDLVGAVDDTGKAIFIDRFGTQTTSVPDDNYFIENKGSPLYKLDNLNQEVASSPASIRGESSGFDFGEEGDNLVEIVTDPIYFNATVEADATNSGVYWGKDFMLVNVDDGDQPVSIDIRPGKYNAANLAAEVERAINEAYGDDKKIQLFQNVDDTLTIDFTKIDANGDPSTLATPISIDLLQDTHVSTNLSISTAGGSPDFSREELLAHTQARVTDELNDYVLDSSGAVDSTKAAAMGVASSFFARTNSTAMTAVYADTDIVTIDYKQANTALSATTTEKVHLAYTYVNKKPALEVYKDNTAVYTPPSGTAFSYADGIVEIKVPMTSALSIVNQTVRVAGPLVNTLGAAFDGQTMTVLEKVAAPVTTASGAVSNTSRYTASIGDSIAGDTIKVITGGLTLTTTVGSTDALTLSNLQAALATVAAAASPAITTFSVASSGVAGSFEFTDSGSTVMSTGASVAGTEQYYSLKFDATGLNLSAADFTGDLSGFKILSSLSTDVEAFFEGGEKVVDGVFNTFASNKIVIREKPSAANHSAAYLTYIGGADKTFTLSPVAKTPTISVTNSDRTTVSLGNLSPGDTLNITTGGVSLSATVGADDAATLVNLTAALRGQAAANNFTVVDTGVGTFEFDDPTAAVNVSTSHVATGTEQFTNSSATTTALGLAALTTQIQWADEKAPPLKVGFDATNQRLTFTADRAVLGTGGDGGFDSFSISGNTDATSANRLGIPGANNAASGLIRGGEVLSTGSFVADGQEIQLQNKRYGMNVAYSSDTASFTVSSGSTGESIDANGAMGVATTQKASDIKVGRYLFDTTGGAITETLADTRIIGSGANTLFGFGVGKNKYEFSAARGLAAAPAVATGIAAQSDLTSVFRLGATGGENVFNISVNGISGIIEVPSGNYVGSTLAEALQEKVNQISDPTTGDTVGGVTVRYSADGNNFVFSTGTTGDTSTIKVKGTATLGLSDVPLGVGSVPKIKNLVQATNSEGIALYVSATGDVVTSPPDNMVTGYYPLYIDEGELTFDKTGALVSPKNDVRYDQQSEGFSITLNIDYSSSTQLAQPFSVLSVEQDGFTSGRLDGLEIDSSGTIRANYTNGENNPLGKIVVVNFNNQNGLKQIGNATYVETAVSGTPTVGEAGAEGFGTILSGSLERSNVDITEELVNLITAQRNYQASAKAIETTTSLNQTIINIRM